MFMLSCIFVIVCGLFVWKRVYVGLFIYVLSLEIQLSKRNGYDPITGLAMQYIWIWIPMSNDIAFQRDDV
jgi:hypothetical protein